MCVLVRPRSCHGKNQLQQLDAHEKIQVTVVCIEEAVFGPGREPSFDVNDDEALQMRHAPQGVVELLRRA